MAKSDKYDANKACSCGRKVIDGTPGTTFTVAKGYHLMRCERGVSHVEADANTYDPNENPVSGPFAGLDPAQDPVIVDPKGQKVGEWQEIQGVERIADGPFDTIDKLAQLCSTHIVQIEYGAASTLPTHRIVLGFGEQPFAEQLAQSLDAALLHHSTKEA